MTDNNRCRNFVVTNWNCDEKKCETLIENGQLKFIAYGKERCPSTDREHFQTYISFHNGRKPTAKLLGWIGGLWGDIRCNVAPMYGSLKQNESYCSKESTLTKLGVEPKQGNRADLRDVIERIKQGTETVENLMLDDPGYYHQYGRTLTKAEDVVNRRKCRKWMTVGEWYWGPTGVGKSHKAFEGYDPETHYVKPVLDEWWDGYCGQEVVIFNDFRGQLPFSELLNLVDKWPHYVKRRCREPTPFLAKKVIVTSSMEPRLVYNNILGDADAFDQLERRFNIVHMAQKCSEGNNEPLSKKQKVAGLGP